MSDSYNDETTKTFEALDEALDNMDPDVAVEILERRLRKYRKRKAAMITEDVMAKVDEFAEHYLRSDREAIKTWVRNLAKEASR